MIAHVTQVAPLRIKEDGALTALPAFRLASYTPTLGDRVQAVRDNGQLIVQGAIV